MAKKVGKVKVQPVYDAYRVVAEGVGRALGPHKVMDQDEDRVVMLTDKQAKYYLDQGAIERL